MIYAYVVKNKQGLYWTPSYLLDDIRYASIFERKEQAIEELNEYGGHNWRNEYQIIKIGIVEYGN